MPKKPKKIRQTFTHNGETRDLLFRSQREADEWYNAMKRQSDRVKAGLPVAKEDILFKFASARWIVFRSKTADYWRYDEAKFRRGFVPKLGEKSIRSITKADCEQALHELRTELELADATFNRYRSSLHTFFTYLVDEGYRETNPISKIELLAEVPKGILVSDEEVARYLELAKQEKESLWFFPYMVLAMNAGPRCGELLGFRWRDFQPDRGLMEIKVRYQVSLKKEKDGTKGGRARAIPLNNFVIRVLTEFRAKTPYNREDDFIFHNSLGVRASPHTLANIHRRIRKDAKLPIGARVYDITRHKFASELAKVTGNMRLVQLILGHSSTQMTERYAHHSPDYIVRQAAEVKVGEEVLKNDLGKNWEPVLQ